MGRVMGFGALDLQVTGFNLAQTPRRSELLSLAAEEEQAGPGH